MLQLYFEDVAGLGAAQRHRQILAMPDALPSLRGAATTRQATRVRAYSVPEPRPWPVMCGYHMAYEGEADDVDARVAHRTTHHNAIMACFPSVVEIEVGTRLDWRGALGWPHVNHRLRNKVVLHDPPGLTAALHPPARRDMRSDYATFRQFTGPVTHFPMRIAVIDLPRCAHAVTARERRG